MDSQDLAARPHRPRLPRPRPPAGRTSITSRTLIECFFLLQTAESAYHEGQRRGLPIGILNAPEDLLADEHLRARGFFVEVDHPGHGPVTAPGRARTGSRRWRRPCSRRPRASASTRRPCWPDAASRIRRRRRRDPIRGRSRAGSSTRGASQSPSDSSATVDGEPHLVGSACRACGAVTFPAQGSCTGAPATDVERRPLATTGTLWAFTVQGFPPKTPYLQARAPFTPFGVGYVDLGGEVLVEARLVAGDLESLRIGQPMELVLEPLHRRRHRRGRSSRTPSPRRCRSRATGEHAVTEVAIVGIGIHPFGRTDGVSGRDQGAVAARAALRDAGIGWDRRAVRVRRQLRRRQRRRARRRSRADRHRVRQRRQRLRHRRQCAGDGRPGHPLGRLRRRHGDRVRQAPAGRVQRRPRRVRARRVVRRDRPDGHHAVLRHEDPALPARPRHRPGGAVEDRGQGVPQRGAQPQRLAPHAAVAEARSPHRRWSATR